MMQIFQQEQNGKKSLNEDLFKFSFIACKKYEANVKYSRILIVIIIQ